MKKSMIVTLVTLLFAQLVHTCDTNLNGKVIKRATVNGVEFVLLAGDITRLKNVDALVNAANFNYLEYPGGLALAIKNAAGPLFDQEWKEGIETGFFKSEYNFHDGENRAVLLPAHNLSNRNIKWIIQAVGPTGDDADWKSKLRTTYTNLIHLAETQKLKTIAIPALSRGIFAKNMYGKEEIGAREAARIAIRAIVDFVIKSKRSIKKIYFVIREQDAEDLKAYSEEWDACTAALL